MKREINAEQQRRRRVRRERKQFVGAVSGRTAVAKDNDPSYSTPDAVFAGRI
jgi:hypothetical protein